MSSQKKPPVFISVYIVGPRRSTRDWRRHHHHHHHHVHHYVHGGYNRKAALLQYCQQLRATARREQASPAPKIKPNPPANRIIPLRRNRSIARNPSCLGNWKRVLLPGFILRSADKFRMRKEKQATVKKMNDSLGNAMHAIVKSLGVEKRQGFVKKLVSAFRGHK